MKLTKKKAIELSIELWSWLAETGADSKRDWDGWEKYGEMLNDCALCKYREEHSKAYPPSCRVCSYYQKFGCCYGKSGKPSTIYDHWEDAETTEQHKEYASKFLEQLKQL